MRRRAASRCAAPLISARLVNAPARGWHPALSSHDLRISRLCISPFASPFVEIYYGRARAARFNTRRFRHRRRPPLQDTLTAIPRCSVSALSTPVSLLSFRQDRRPLPFPFPAFLRLPSNHRVGTSRSARITTCKREASVRGCSGIRGCAGKRSQGLDGR